MAGYSQQTKELAQKIASKVSEVNWGHKAPVLAHYMKDIALDIWPEIQIDSTALGSVYSEQIEQSDGLIETIEGLCDEAYFDYDDVNTSICLAQALKNSVSNNHDTLVILARFSGYYGQDYNETVAFLKAKRYIEEALSIQDTDPETHLLMSKTLVSLGNKEEAEKHYKVAARIFGGIGGIDDPVIAVSMGDISAYLGKGEVAGKLFAHSVTFEGGAEELFLYAQKQEEIGNGVVAISAYQALLENDKNNVVFINSIGNCLIRNSEFVEARTYFDLVLGLAEEDQDKDWRLEALSSACLNISTSYFYEYYKNIAKEKPALHALKNAGKYAKKAISYSDQNGHAVNSYATYQKYYADLIKNPEKKQSLLFSAKEGFFKARSLGYNSINFHDRLAEIFSDIQDPINASFHANEALLEGGVVKISSAEESQGQGFPKDFPEVKFGRSTLIAFANSAEGFDPKFEAEVEQFLKSSEGSAAPGSDPRVN